MKVRATAGAVVVKDDQVLLVKRGNEPFKGYWTLPGGHIDYGETASAACAREVKEETGLTINPEFIGYRDEIYPELEWHGEALIFTGTPTGEEKIDGSEIVDIKWVSVDDALGMKLAFEHEQSIDMWRQKWKNKK